MDRRTASGLYIGGMKFVACAFLVLIAAPAMAEERDFCADRPGQATPPCTVEPGRAMVEVGIADWTHDRTAQTTNDMVALADLLIRTGIGETSEIQLGWAAYGFARDRDRASGAATHAGGTGDVTLALQKTLGKPGDPVAIRAYATLPTGGATLGAGDWGAGAMVPMAFDLSDAVEFDLTPEIDAAVDTDGNGRHLAFGTVAGFGFSLSDRWSMAVDAALFRDNDPAIHSTRATAGASLAWMAGKDTQLDMGAIAGLNRDTPDMELYLGVVRRF